MRQVFRGLGQSPAGTAARTIGAGIGCRIRAVLSVACVLATVLAVGGMPAAAQGEDPSGAPAMPGEGPVQVGVVSLVNPDATLDRATLLREPGIGDDVLLADRLATDAAGQVHLMLLDKSAFTIGPNSDVTIDRFVYDPETRSGEMALSAVRGVMRFVGGDLSKERPVEIRTGTGTLGIRGGILILDIQENGGITAIFGYGVELTVETALGDGAFESVNRAGFMVQIAPDGTIGSPVPAPAAIVQEMLRTLEAPAPTAPDGPPEAGVSPVEAPPSEQSGTGEPQSAPVPQIAGGPAPTGAGNFPLPPTRVQVVQALSQAPSGLVLDGRPVTIDNLVESDGGLLASVEGNLVSVNEILSDTIDQAVAEATQAGGAPEVAVAATVPQLLAEFRFLVFDEQGIAADKVWLEVTDGITSIVLNSGNAFTPVSSPDFADDTDLTIANPTQYFVYDNTFQEGAVDFNFFMKDASPDQSGDGPFVGVEMVSDIDSITDNSTQGPNNLGDLTGTNQDQIDTQGVTECANLSGCAAFGTITVNASNP